MTNLKARRDELAKNTEFEINGEIYSPSKSITYATYDDMEKAFKAGFDAAISELKPEIEELVKALDCITTFNNGVSAMEIGEARAVLTKYKEFMGDGE